MNVILPAHIIPGATFSNISGSSTFTVVSLDSRGGFTAKRANDKTFKVPSSRIKKARELLAVGPVNFRVISYTVAIEAGVVFALRDEMTVDATTKRYVAV